MIYLYVYNLLLNLNVIFDILEPPVLKKNIAHVWSFKYFAFFLYLCIFDVVYCRSHKLSQNIWFV